MANKKKDIKKKSNKINMSKSRFDENILNKLIIVLSIICFLGLFYLLTIHITNKNSDDDNSSKNDEKEEVSISYDEIIIGRSLTMSDDDYLVFCYDKEDEELSKNYNELISNYKAKEDSLALYIVDMSNYFNKSFSTDGNSNKNPISAKDLAINGPTLFRVTDKHISEYFEDEEAISNYLK